ncbi:MAG: calcium/sodium antiporter [Phycisphaerales bacterium]|nr:calcium/sodium antiporter [Phycisphaerales bacterium]
MLIHTLWFGGGLLLLLVGGKLMVTGSVDAARRLRVSPLVVGLTLVAWGTSAPELALNLISASKGRSDLAVGNVLGANICNMALVLGVCALIRPLVVQERLIKIEIWLNAGMLGIVSALGLTVGFSRASATLMLGLFLVYSIWTIISAMRSPHTAEGLDPATRSDSSPDATSPGPPMGWLMIGTSFVGGLALLGIGGSLASDGAASIAVGFGIPAALVGVTIVSIGTTLPELVTSVVAVRNKQTDLAMGNCIGSCLFNTGAIFGITGLITPVASIEAFIVPLWFAGALGIALIIISRTFDKRVSRLEGGLLLATYAAFLIASAYPLLVGSPPTDLRATP